jgi:hypothetical protein
MSNAELRAVLCGAVKTAITDDAADAILATVNILRQEREQLRQLLGDLAHAADDDSWDYDWSIGQYKELLDRIYEVLGEKR